ncbi:hypothetical protein [endosymbiont GvMRE of Glomus versiforme]|uniref:hypothetical protein n=1 Tax=endosymbiont GvMRE of Glomus versiforme TaxID=2039283 RepID=UPI000ECB9055|nr:hypothetical protein [endosymbiont GvMRE of Glomus versiforme]RHZ36317.1 hypothetical protein GvMRE_Ic1g42 [endosymbiont GvMRE of Glomus versiforme]
MLKFKFDYLNNTLAYQKGEYWYEIIEEFQGSFGSQGFQLDNGWISFTLYEKQIKIFAKKESLEGNDFLNPEPAIYYRKYLPKQRPLIFTFEDKDQVEKINGRWGKKHA